MVNNPIKRIDDKCNKCMLCVKACGYGVWQEIDKEPSIVNPDACFECSHCLAVCPKEAIVHNFLDVHQIIPIERQLANPDAYREIVKGRRSIRHFKDKPVSDDIIEGILDTAYYSPTASCREDVRYIIISDKGLMHEISQKMIQMFRFLTGEWMSKIVEITTGSNEFVKFSRSRDYLMGQHANGRDLILHNAPVLIVIHAPKRPYFANENCNIAAANIMNYAYALGLGTCYIGILVKGLALSWKLRRKIKLPAGHKAYACIVLGYSDFKYIHTVSRKKSEPDWI